MSIGVLPTNDLHAAYSNAYRWFDNPDKNLLFIQNRGFADKVMQERSISNETIAGVCWMSIVGKSTKRNYKLVVDLS